MGRLKESPAGGKMPGPGKDRPRLVRRFSWLGKKRLPGPARRFPWLGGKLPGPARRLRWPGGKQPGSARRFPWLGGKQLACVAAGLALGMGAELASGTESALRDGRILDRSSYGQGDVSYELMVEGLREDDVPVEVVLREREYTRREAGETYQKVMDMLPQLILGDNPSLEDVRYPLNLVTYLDDYGIRLRWESDEPEILDSFGEVHGEGLDEQGAQVVLSVRMTEGNWPEEYRIPVQVKPPVLAEEEARRRGFMELLKAEDERQAASERMELPGEYLGHSLTYRMEQEPVFLPMAGLGAAGAILLTLKDRSDARSRESARKQQMMLDYPEILSRLTIFLGAGMSIRTAWDKIGLEYEKMKEQGRRTRRYAYEEMYETSCQMKAGVPEGAAFEEFGRRCGLQSYIRLAGLLEQNRKNGSKNLKSTLKIEMADAFEQRKHQARRLGEEAGTKLLLPLFMMLSVVMIMIAVPALMEFR